MKKFAQILLACMFIISLTACSKREENIKIVIPAGNDDTVIYSEGNITAERKKISIITVDGVDETTAVLKPVGESEFMPIGKYIDHAVAAEFETEKEKSYKVGISVDNPTYQDIVVTIKLEGAEYEY